MENPSVLIAQTRAADKCRSVEEELEAAALPGTSLMVLQSCFVLLPQQLLLGTTAALLREECLALPVLHLGVKSLQLSRENEWLWAALPNLIVRLDFNELSDVY